MPIATKEARYAASQAVMPHMGATLQPARNFTSIWVPKGYFLLSNDPHITAQCEYIRKEFAERLQILSQHPVQMTCGSSQMLFADRKSFDLKQIMEASAQTADICKTNLGNSRSQRQEAQITNMKTLSFSGVGLKSAQFPENGTSLASLVAMSAQAGQQYSLPKLPPTLHPKQALALITTGTSRMITCLRRRRLIDLHPTISKTMPGAA